MPDYSDLWATLSNTAGGTDRTGTQREPTSGEIMAYEAIKRGYIEMPDPGEAGPLPEGGGDNYVYTPKTIRIPVDQYGWYQYPGSPYKINVWTNNYIPADEATSAQTIGKVYNRERSGLFSGPMSFLNPVADFVYEDIMQPTGEMIRKAPWMVPLAFAGGAYALGGGAAGAGAAGAGGAASGSGALGADLAGLGGLTTEGAMAAAELGAGSTYGGLVGAAGAGAEAAGAMAPFAVDQSLAMAAVEAVAPAADNASKMTLLQKILAEAANAADKGAKWGAKDYVTAGVLALTGLATIAQIAQGGDQTTSATTTRTTTGAGDKTVAGTDKTAGDMTFDEYIDDVFNVSGTGKGIKERITEDQTALTGYQKGLLDTIAGLDTSRLTGTREAVTPFQQQLQKVLDMEKTGTGYYKPFNYSFGGTAMPSFVPKNQLSTMNTALGTGRESASLGTALVDQEYESGVNRARQQYGFESENLPNKAANTYTKWLEDTMKYFNPSGVTETTTGTVPGVPWTTELLQGLTTGTNFWGSINNPRTPSAADLLAWLQAGNKGG